MHQIKNSYDENYVACAVTNKIHNVRFLYFLLLCQLQCQIHNWKVLQHFWHLHSTIQSLQIYF